MIQIPLTGSTPLDMSLVLTGTNGASVFTYNSKIGAFPANLGYNPQHTRSTTGPALRAGELPNWTLPFKAFVFFPRITTTGTVPILSSVNVKNVKRLSTGEYEVNFMNNCTALNVSDDTGSVYRAPYMVMSDVSCAGTRGDFFMRSAGRGVAQINLSSGSYKYNTGFRINIGSMGSNSTFYTDNDFAYAYLFAYGSNYYK